MERFSQATRTPMLMLRAKCSLFGSGSLLVIQVLQSYEEIPGNRLGADEDFHNNLLKSLYHQIEPDSKRELLTRIISTGKNVPGKTAPHLVYLKRDLSMRVPSVKY